jgi:hypothetical protein
MKVGFLNGLSRPAMAMVALLSAFCRKLSGGLEKFIPLGYEDENGFHVDSSDHVSR